MTLTTYDEVVNITKDYLGPAAERFISKQVTFHLKKEPQELAKTDLPKLTEWIRVSIALLTEDSKMVDDCVGRISKLAA
jgi:hypothetical protein